MKNHPMQPLLVDEHGTHRFKANAIVRHLLDHGGIDLNQIACLEFSAEDQTQFAQLIGYSVCGFGDLSYVLPTAYDAAIAMSDALNEGDSDAYAEALATPITDEECDLAIDEALVRELAMVRRQSELNETRWREAGTRATVECGLRQWYEDELGKLRAWLTEPEFLSDPTTRDARDYQTRIDAILAGPPPKKADAEEPSDG